MNVMIEMNFTIVTCAYDSPMKFCHRAKIRDARRMRSSLISRRMRSSRSRHKCRLVATYLSRSERRFLTCASTRLSKWPSAAKSRCWTTLTTSCV